MNKRLTFSLLALIVVFAMTLSACGSAATPAPTAMPAPTQAPAATDTQAPTAVPATATAAPTAKPTAVPPVCNKLPDAPAAPAAGQLGASDTPITIAFVPSGESGVIATASSAIADCLNKMTGLNYTI